MLTADARSNSAGRSPRGEGGFTLVELLVVISIIGLLLVTLIVGVQGIKIRSQIAAASAFIDALKDGCTNYRETFGAGRAYPPQTGAVDYTATNGNSSAVLVTYLGTKLLKYAAYTTTPGIPMPPPVEYKPLMQFTEEQRDGNYLVDIWQRRILYFNQTGGQTDPCAGFPGHEKMYPGTSSVHCDILSFGLYEAGQDENGVDSRISTFRKP